LSTSGIASSSRVNPYGSRGSQERLWYATAIAVDEKHVYFNASKDLIDASYLMRTSRCD
jgi:hypothetical protein